jgi:hypothetical protein
MATTYTLMSIWDRRGDQWSDVSASLPRFIHAIRAIDGRLTMSHGTASSRAKALRRRMDTDEAVLGELKRIKPVDGQTTEETCWLASYWNGAPDDSNDTAALSVSLGGNRDEESPSLLANSVSLSLPLVLGKLSEPFVALALMVASIECFQPDWISFYTEPYEPCYDEKFVRRSDWGGPLLGWRTYVADRVAKTYIPKRARGVVAKPWQSGWIVEVGDRPLDPINSKQDFNALDVVRKELGWQYEGELIPFTY